MLGASLRKSPFKHAVHRIAALQQMGVDVLLLRSLFELVSFPGRVRHFFGDRYYRSIAEIEPTALLMSSARIMNMQHQRNRVTVGARTVVRGELFVFPHGGCIRVGAWGYVGENSRIWSAAAVVIGDRVLIAHDVNIHDTNGHPLAARRRHEQQVEIVEVGHPSEIADVRAAPITIGNDAWIGFGSTILKGVTVGPGAIVAAHSVVTEDVAPWTIVGGNPARVIRELGFGEC